jgi:hypothetical protein
VALAQAAEAAGFGEVGTTLHDVGHKHLVVLQARRV